MAHTIKKESGCSHPEAALDLDCVAHEPAQVLVFSSHICLTDECDSISWPAMCNVTCIHVIHEFMQNCLHLITYECKRIYLHMALHMS